ncbi:P-loop containing nucleoside triphosphate hydrolase protein [Lojkania enalia]|uniref:ATP-dependent DNA helicase n=1 Tax=Lojkania enalia TaxID=147567 RepID=A0A9P4NCH5_9PLEO|nr:P-loop containing nucleoside triphosphate hydrolase protein [Didymosphaeria enalia]
MDDSDEYGEFDESAFLEAATQAEKESRYSFHQLPRPLKRRRIDPPNERTSIIPPRSAHRAGRQKASPGLSSDDGFESVLSVTSLTGRRKKNRSSLEDAEGPSSASASGSPPTKRKPPKSSGAGNGSGDQKDELIWKKPATKRKDRIHTPTNNLELQDLVYTQPPREHSPPWKTRGAIWQKPAINIGMHRPSNSQISKWTVPDTMHTMTLPGKNSILSQSASRQTKLPIQQEQLRDHEETTQSLLAIEAVKEYDPTEDLEDLPSDAFASSSLPQKQDDDMLLVPAKRMRVVAPKTGLRQTTLFDREGVESEVSASLANKSYNFVVTQKEEPPTHHKLDPEAMKTWVYPTNLGTIRDYQFNIVARGLYHNLLVALPTGLGKTFIAATIILNWYRWATEAQIVFVAPTKPLVSQQVGTCFNIAGIPRSQTTLLTGSVSPGLRAEEWASKRVFFMTPQTLLNDLKSGYADPKKIVLLVVDEAHRATGSYAYVEVVALMRRFNPSFRILALTATPGSDVESVQKVIDSLDISRIEIRTENSLDIRQFVHHRKVEKHVFTNSDEMEMCMELYSEALQSTLNKVASQNVFWSRNPLDLTPYGCTQARAKWAQSPAGRSASFPVKGMVNAVFSILGSVSMGMELLKYHGIGPFYTKMKDFRDDQALRNSKSKKEICNSDAFKKLMSRLQAWASSKDFVGHPKLEFLQQAILDHFVNASEGLNPDGAPPAQTRIMVFAHWRDSAEEIVRVLKRHEPIIRPRVFVGQASAKHSEGMAQSEQVEVIEKFKKGTYNTLVATSIGEEGLDIGEVDLIICYDSKASPIRMLQRMGRTGRKREGKIILLQMEGKEVRDFEKAKDNYEKMQELIAEGSRFTFHDEVSRRIVPRDVQPIVDKRIVEIPLENSQSDFMPEPRKNGRAPKKPPKKFHMPDGVITGFVTAGQIDEEISPQPRGKKKALPPRPSEVVVAVPPLEAVLLDDTVTKDLERRYQTVFGEDDAPSIDTLDLRKFPARQRVLSRVKYFRRPGRVARGFVETLQRIHLMDDARINHFRRNFNPSDIDSKLENDVVVPDDIGNGRWPEIDVDMWQDDDPASQQLPEPRAKSGPKPKAKATSKATTSPRGRPRKGAAASTTPSHELQAGAVPCATSSRVRSRQTQPTWETPTHQLKAKGKNKAPTYRMSNLVEEGVSSSPPPTDPGMRLASQAESLGSVDTDVEDQIQDTQAYRLDSDLRSFIADDDEEIETPTSSLPSLNTNVLGKGTQAVVRGYNTKRPTKAEKLFTSDPTDNDALVSSDSDSDAPLWRSITPSAKSMACIGDLAAEEDDDKLIQLKRRARRIIVSDDEDED